MKSNALRIFLNISFLIYLSACSRYENFTKTQIVISKLTSTNQTDLILNGISDEDEFFTYHLRGNQTNAPVELPTGNWTFYGFYWEDRVAYCTVKEDVTLDGLLKKLI